MVGNESNESYGNVDQAFGVLAWASSLGFLLQILWVLIVGAVDLDRFDRASTRFMLVIALALIALAITSRFRGFIERLASQPILPAQVLVINLLSMLLVGAFLLILLDSNPHVLANPKNLRDGLFLGGLFVLILFSLLANLIAYRIDRNRS